MSLYKDQDLFRSGVHRFHVHGLSERHQKVEQPGSDGAEVVTLGRTARTIDQTGTLAADTIGQLQQQLDAIEAAMDGTPGELVDEWGRPWSGMILVDFSPAAIRRLGLRLIADYTARYVQTNQTLPLPGITPL